MIEKQRQKLLRLEVQFQLIKYLKINLEKYQPTDEKGSAIPIVFKANKDCDYKKDVANFLAHLEVTQVLSEAHESSHLTSKDDLDRLGEFNKKLTKQTDAQTTESFLKDWHHILTQYIKKTLPTAFSKARLLVDADVWTISTKACGLYEDLLSEWMRPFVLNGNLSFESLEENADWLNSLTNVPPFTLESEQYSQAPDYQEVDRRYGMQYRR